MFETLKNEQMKIHRNYIWLVLFLVLSFGVSAQYSAQITEVEFFWGASDPGTGNGTAISAQDGSYNDAVEAVFQSNVAPPNLGLNILNIRMRGTDGAWGRLFKNVIYVDASFSSDIKITQGEFYIDTDNGYGNNTPLLAVDGNFDNAIEAALRSNITAPSAGVHVLGARFLGLDGSWGRDFKIIFNVDASFSSNLHIVQGEFFFDTDPGPGSGTAMVAGDGNFNSCIETALASPSSASLSEGLHKLSVRMKGVDGTWGRVFSVVVIVDACSPSPVATVTSGGSTTICPGNNVTLTANAGTGLTYQWLKDGSIISGATSQSFDAAAAGYYSVAVTNSGGCTTVSDSVVVTVGGLSSSVSIVSNAGTVTCVGDEVTFTATPVNGGSTPVYQWQINGANVGTNAATYTTNSLVNNAVIRCILTSSEACVFPETDTSNLITMAVRALPSDHITLNGSTVLCSGESITLTAEAGNTYLWNTGATSQVLTVSTAGEYFVTVTSPNSCSVKSDTIEVTVRASSASSIAATICAGETYNFEGTSLNSQGVYTHTLQNQLGCDSIVTLTLTVNNPVTHSISETACGSYTWTSGNGQTYTSNTTVSYTFANGASNGCDSTVTLILTINNVDNTVSLSGITLTAHQTGGTYQWLDCNNGNAPVSGEIAQSFEPTVNGNYAVEITVNGCTEISNCVVVNSVGIQSLGENSWNVYPNPNNGIFTVVSSQEFNNATIEIYSPLGQLVYKQVHSGDNIVIDLSEQPTGVYILKVNNHQNFRVVKL